MVATSPSSARGAGSTASDRFPIGRFSVLIAASLVALMVGLLAISQRFDRWNLRFDQLELGSARGASHLLVGKPVRSARTEAELAAVADGWGLRCWPRGAPDPPSFLPRSTTRRYFSSGWRSLPAPSPLVDVYDFPSRQAVLLYFGSTGTLEAVIKCPY
jgi:hypothetical protein